MARPRLDRVGTADTATQPVRAAVAVGHTAGAGHRQAAATVAAVEMYQGAVTETATGEEGAREGGAPYRDLVATVAAVVLTGLGVRGGRH